MENANNKLGYLCEYFGGKEIKEWITREDLTSNDQDKKELVQGWIVGLVEPWSASAEFFDIKRNVKYDGTKVAETEAWKATYTSIFYDTMESVIVAYGATPDKALKNVEKILEEMEAIYEERYAKDEEKQNELEEQRKELDDTEYWDDDSFNAVEKSVLWFLYSRENHDANKEDIEMICEAANITQEKSIDTFDKLTRDGMIAKIVDFDKKERYVLSVEGFEYMSRIVSKTIDENE